MFVLFSNLFLSVFSFIPNWNLKNSSINLLDGRTSWSYTITHREMYDVVAKLEKNITKTTEGITHKNTLFIDETSKGIVSFENIESFYKLGVGDNNYRYLLCPIGKFHLINFDNMEEITNNNIDQSNNWDLKCYNHNSGYFFSFYLMNGEQQVFNLDSNNNYEEMSDYKLHRELYDFKLVNKENDQSGNPYPMFGIISWRGYIQFLATEYNLENQDGVKTSKHLSKQLISIKSHTQGYFDNNTNHFYYFTYNNVSDFSSGYSTQTVEGENYYTIDPIEVVNNNLSSPIEFVDEVEIKEMNFVVRTKYIYYAIYNKKLKKLIMVY